MNRITKIPLLVALATGCLFTTACHEDGYVGVGVRTGPAYYGDHDDFYYTDTYPYSRSYGRLYLRDGRHYYRHGGRYVVYNRPTITYRDWNSRHRHYEGRRVYRH